MPGNGVTQPMLLRQLTRAPRIAPKVSWLSFGGSGIAVPVVALHLLIGAFLWQRFELREDIETFGDAFYFAVETFLTIGYGDIQPASQLAKLFFIAFTLASCVVQLTVLSTVLSSSLEFSPSVVLPQSTAREEQECDRTFFKVRPRAIRAAQGFGMLGLLLAAGAVLLRWSSYENGEPLPWLDCAYWSVTTISTVGYGDIVPHPRWRPVFAVFFLLSVVLFAYILGESLALVADIGKYRQLHRFFAKGLTQEMLDIMDCYEGDGRVQREEFLMFVLQHLGVVDGDDMERILAMFNSLDTSGDGVLDIQDVKRAVSTRLSGTSCDLGLPTDVTSNAS
eukprot:jgi/Ulvmu1/2542/UM139_0010.1